MAFDWGLFFIWLDVGQISFCLQASELSFTMVFTLENCELWIILLPFGDANLFGIFLPVLQ